MLLAGSSPVDKVELAIDAEFDLIENSVQLGSHRQHLRIVLSRDTEAGELVAKMLGEKPSVVHFSGHGNQQSELFFENEHGQSVAVGVDQLSKMFAGFSGVVRCVVLNACYSVPQAEAIAHHADCVVGMSDRVSDAAAHTFATNFYKAMASGRDVATSFDLAVVNIDLAGIPEAKTPALFGRERAAMLVFDGQQVDDKEVTTSVVAGIEAIARQLYESEYLSLVRLASTIIDSVSVCEGIVQEAFVEILTTEMSPIVTGVDGVLAVLRKLVLDIAQDRRDVAQQLFPAQLPPTATSASDEVTKVLRAIQSLAQDEAQALVLSQLSKLDPATISSTLGMEQGHLDETIRMALDNVGSLLEALG
ncbi:hypothetical protein YM304_07400 [Ilumatobacter coccineus YM16-304]|uniref:CHAT domain-containing protein n=1 Tax=Ilumatobacter coccineus (strain NBRC 103263 / KCTC 29153 / YM16-304) TaxID=1313172 RepID=A0A6C7DX68_ILUCY|nr:hypothetical protein YM304_07400 [Ilumatobacter coccineus YM16-304]